MKVWKAAVAAMLMSVAAGASADVYDAVRAKAEMTMVAKGTIDIAPDGRVTAYALDEADKLPPAVRKVTDRATESWRFEPVLVEGKAVPARTRMSLRVIARKSADADTYEIEIASADFRVDTPPEERPNRRKIERPVYPMAAARSDMGGVVYVVAKIGRDGRVVDAFAEQVNLTTVDRERAMDGWRKMLANAALRAAREWTFDPPTRGDEVEEPFWQVRIPFGFIVQGRSVPSYGEWELYVPGPRQRAPWMDAADFDASSSDAIAGDDISQVGKGLRLLTSLNGS